MGTFKKTKMFCTKTAGCKKYKKVGAAVRSKSDAKTRCTKMKDVYKHCRIVKSKYGYMSYAHFKKTAAIRAKRKK